MVKGYKEVTSPWMRGMGRKDDHTPSPGVEVRIHATVRPSHYTSSFYDY